jgi:Ca2+:H+ antiporter
VHQLPIRAPGADKRSVLPGASQDVDVLLRCHPTLGESSPQIVANLKSYLIGLWFSLRTHASQIWQNPQQVMKVDEPPAGAMHPAHRASLYQRLTPQAVMQQLLPTHRQTSNTGHEREPPKSATAPEEAQQIRQDMPPPPATAAPYQGPTGYTPFLETIHRDLKAESCTPMRLPSSLTTEDFTRAVAAATVSALRQQNSIPQTAKARPTSGADAAHDDDSEGGHEGPSWSRGMSATVLLSCTLLYAIIAGE